MNRRSTLGVALLVLALSEAWAADPYETPPTLAASDLLPTELLEGERHVVDPEVTTDGFVARFTIHSDYGTYRETSAEDVARRVHEIGAIHALDEMQRGNVAGNAVIGGVQQPFLAARNVLTRPIETAEQVGESLGRWLERGKLSLRKAGRKVEETARDLVTDEEPSEAIGAEAALGRLAEQEIRARALDQDRDPDAAVAAYRQRRDAPRRSETTDAAERRDSVEWAAEQVEKAAYRYVGYDRARRQLARQLRVDPYSDHFALQERLDAVAWAVWAGQLGVGALMPSNELLESVEEVDDLVWAHHPKDLEIENRKTLDTLGVDGDILDAFFDNPRYTLSQRVAMVADVASLHGVDRRDHVVRLAAGAAHRRQAVTYQRSIRALAVVHADQPLETLVASSEHLVVAIDRGGDAHLVLPVDHLAWTESLDLVIGGIDRHRRAVGFEGRMVLILGGEPTPRARRGVEAFGWQVKVAKTTTP